MEVSLRKPQRAIFKKVMAIGGGISDHTGKAVLLPEFIGG